jgi:hypothetical protein
MKAILKITVFLCISSINYCFAQNMTEINPQGTANPIYSRGVGNTDIESFYRTSIFAEIPSTTPNTTNKTFTGLLGLANSNGANAGIVGIGKTNLSNSTYAIGTEGRVSILQGIGIGVAGRAFASSVASDEAIGGQFESTALNNTNGNIKLVGVESSLNSNFNTISATGHGIETRILGNFSQFVYGNSVQITLGSNNTAVAYGGHFSINAPVSSQTFGIYSFGGTTSNKYAAWLNGRVRIGSTFASNDMLEVEGVGRFRHTTQNAGIWFNNQANGLGASDGAFIGMETAIVNSERFGIRLGNDWKLTVSRAGVTAINGDLQIGGTIGVGGGTITKHIRIETTMGIVYPANNFTTLTVTAIGAAVGDNVILNFTGDIGSLIISQVWVSATNTVSVKLYNPTGSSNAFPNSIPVRIILTR